MKGKAKAYEFLQEEIDILFDFDTCGDLLHPYFFACQCHPEGNVVRDRKGVSRNKEPS
jgi:hypothetical protein